MGQTSSSPKDAECLVENTALASTVEHVPECVPLHSDKAIIADTPSAGNDSLEHALRIAVSDSLKESSAGDETSEVGTATPSSAGSSPSSTSHVSDGTSSDGDASWRSSELSVVLDIAVTVKHTFFHFEGQPLSDDGPPRRNKSLPPSLQHQRQRGLTVACDHVSNSMSVQTPKSDSAKLPPVLPTMAIGAEVELRDLLRAPAFNGLTGVVTSWDADMCRYDVLIDLKNAPSRVVKVKRENIQPCLPPPPLHGPSMATDEDEEQSMPSTPRWDEVPLMLGTDWECAASSQPLEVSTIVGAAHQPYVFDFAFEGVSAQDRAMPQPCAFGFAVDGMVAQEPVGLDVCGTWYPDPGDPWAPR